MKNNYRRAKEIARTTKWEIGICDQGEICWCRTVKCITPVMYTPDGDAYVEGYECEYFPIGTGAVDKEMVEHIVYIHNRYIDDQLEKNILINQQLLIKEENKNNMKTQKQELLELLDENLYAKDEKEFLEEYHKQKDKYTVRDTKTTNLGTTLNVSGTGTGIGIEVTTNNTLTLDKSAPFTYTNT